MPNFKNIVLTTDLSVNSRAAIPYAIELASHYHGVIHVVHVSEDTLYQSGTYADGSMGYDPEAWVDMMRDYKARKLQEYATTIQSHPNVRINPVLLHGYAPGEIVKFALENEADCIIIATHGRTGLAHFFNGSVAEKVIRTSPCPVMTVRPDTIVPHNEEAEVSVKASPAIVRENTILAE